MPRLLLLLPVLLMPACLAVLYKKATGHFIIYSYGKEGFDFLHPHFMQFLFHVDNGIFPYTPLMLMPVVLLWAWYKTTNKHQIAGLLATLLVTIYIHSSWWAWSYGFSFGARSMLDFMPLCGIMVGLSLQQVNLKRYSYIAPAYLLCCCLTMLLYHQKSHGGYMNKYPITDYWQAIHDGIGVGDTSN